MPETLIIRFTNADDLVDWVILDSNGAASAAVRGTLAEAATQADDRKVQILAPAISVLRVQTIIPLKGTAKIRQALPFALEEQLAGNIETQHFAFSKEDSSGHIPVAIIDHELIQNWLSRLDLVGLRAEKLFAESDGIAALPATISILINGNTTIIRDHLGEFTIIDTGTLQMVLEMLLDQHSETMENDATTVPVSLLAYCSDEINERYRDLWDRLRMRTETVEIKILGDGALPFIASHIAGNDAVNLLQGTYAPKSDLNIEWGPWRLPTALLAGFVLLALVFKGVLFWQLSREEATLDTAASEVLRLTFPDAGEVADPWSALQSRLGTTTTSMAADGPGFAEALAALTGAFDQTPNIRMETLAFRSGIVDLQLLAPNVDALDKLRQKIGESGVFTATILSANPDKDVIKGRMQIMAVTP